MRAIWKGAVAFGLVNVPIKLYSATGQHDVALHMVHREDAGRIRYRKTCSVCGEEVAQDEIARSHTTDSGEVVLLSDEDLDTLPLTTSREIEVHEFVPADQVDPILLDKTYYLEPDAAATKPYALLREALQQTDRMAVVTVTLRRRESMAVLRVRDDVIVLQTMLWPDEVREAAFDVLDREVEVRPQELQMAASLVESMTADFDPSQFEDGWTVALRELIAAKAQDGDATPAPLPQTGDDGDAQIVDLMAALRASVERTGASRGEPGSASRTASGVKAPHKTAATKKTAAKKAAQDGPADSGKAATTSAAKKPTAATKPAAPKAATAKSTAAKATTAKKAASKAPATKKAAAKKAASKTPAAKSTGTKGASRISEDSRAS